jgi:phage replication-related protein YjqB (UPF0714/DUF867 family)
LILAPHGGGIEHDTSDIALAIAGENFNLYLFEGIKAKGNADLHVTSTRFDEASCLDILSVCDLVVAIHGCRGEDERVLLWRIASNDEARNIGFALPPWSSYRICRARLSGYRPDEHL